MPNGHTCGRYVDLTDDEKAAIYLYTKNEGEIFYKNINDQTNSNSVEIKIKPIIEKINNSLPKIKSTKKNILFRYVNNWSTISGENFYQQDREVTHQAFLSTSENDDDIWDGSNTRLIIYNNPEKLNAYDVSGLSEYEQEKEYLFPLGAKFVVLAEEIDNVEVNGVISEVKTFLLLELEK